MNLIRKIKSNPILVLFGISFFAITPNIRAEDDPWGILLKRGFDRTAVYADTWIVVFSKNSETPAFSLLPYKGFGNNPPNMVHTITDLSFQLKVALDVEEIFLAANITPDFSPKTFNLASVEWDSPTSVLQTLPKLFDEFLGKNESFAISIPIPTSEIEHINHPPPLITPQRYIQIIPGNEKRDIAKEITNLTRYCLETTGATGNASYKNDTTNLTPLAKTEIISTWNTAILPPWESLLEEIDLIEDKGIAVFNFNRGFPMDLWISFFLRNPTHLPPIDSRRDPVNIGENEF